MSTLLHARLAFREKDKNTDIYETYLKNQGFSIKSTNRWGIDFEGTQDLFETCFNCKVTLLPTTSFIGMFQVPNEISSNTESIYFPEKPHFP